MTAMQVIKKFLPIFIGVAAGYAYWYFIGCLGGTCPITSNWYTSVLYGGVVGATWLLPTRKKTTVEPEGTETQEDNVSKS